MGSYQKHIVAFIDFLGFREALKDRARADAILTLLQKLAAFSGDFYADSHEVENGRQSLARPAISAFSDNIVISYQIDELEKHGISIDIAVHFLQNLIAYIAWNAFDARLLVRGGVAIGDLYHAGGVVYGPALIEAYDMERTLAVYPRVALGPSVTLGTDFQKWKNVGWRHSDGVHVIGYIFGFVTRTEPAGGKFNVKVKSWVADVKAKIEAEMSTLSQMGNVRALAKWAWFQSNLEENLTRINPELLQSDGS